MSICSDSIRPDFSYNADKLIEIVFTKMCPIDGDKTIHDLLQVIYKLKPECFQAMGSIHNSEDGTETYQSVKVWVAKSFYLTAHVYGIMRGTCFRVSRMEVRQRSKLYVIIFNRQEEGGGGSRYSTDKCPWWCISATNKFINGILHNTCANVWIF